MRIITFLYAAALLTPVFASAAEDRKAAEQLQIAIPDSGPDRFAIPAPRAAEGDGGAKRIFSENDTRHKRIADALGIGYPCAVEIKHIGLPQQPTEKLTFDDGKRREAVVVKGLRAGAGKSGIGSFMWKKYIKTVSLSKVDWEANPVAIFRNGIEMNKKFKAAGLNVPDIVLADADEPFIATKFVKGTDMIPVLRGIADGDAAALRAMEKFGSAVAAVHNKDFRIGDLNPGNIMFVEGEPLFIDVDRASIGGAKGWDIALPFYYAILHAKAEPPVWAADAARSFLKGYLAGGGDRRNIEDALNRSYLAPLAVFMRPGRMAPIRAVRLEMKKAAGKDASPESDEELGLAR